MTVMNAMTTGTSKIKNYTTLLVKLAIASVLIYWPIRQGTLDFHLLLQLLQERPGDWAIALLILIAISCIACYRWKLLLLLKATSPIPFLQVIKINWIGFLFNPILPGAASGDLVKILYAKDLDQNFSHSYLLSSVLTDRIFGLTAMALIAGIASLLSWNKVVHLSPQLTTLMLANLALLLAFASFIAFLLSPRIIQSTAQKFLLTIPWAGSRMAHFLGHFLFIGKNKTTIALCIALSCICQGCGIFIFWFLSHPHFSPQFSLLDLTTLYPLGIIAVSIPITPLGLGVGHVVFDRLFGFYAIAGGANYFNAYIFTHIVNYLLGVFPYLFSQRQIRVHDLNAIKLKLEQS